MAATQKVMEQLLDGNGEALHLSGELVIAKNKGETFAQHAADTTRHLTTAQVDTAIETALVPIQEELDQIAGGGTGGGGSLEVGDILLTANPARDVSSFLPADGSRIRAEPYPRLGRILGTECVPDSVPETLSFTFKFQETASYGSNYYKISRSPNMFVASVFSPYTQPSTKKYWVSADGINWESRTTPQYYSDIVYLNDQWIYIYSAQISTSTDLIHWEKKPYASWELNSSYGAANPLVNMGYADGVYFCAPDALMPANRKAYISTDGMETWTGRSMSSFNLPPVSAYKDGYYMFFEWIGSKVGVMHYSTDKGETWKAQNLPVVLSNQMQTLELNGKFYLLSCGVVLISTELPALSAWEVHKVQVRYSPTATPVTYTGPVVYAEGLFIAASSYTAPINYAVSTDGLEWTPVKVNLPSFPMSALGTGDGSILISCPVNVNNAQRAALYVAQPTLDNKYYLTLPNVTCPGAKAYVKAL